MFRAGVSGIITTATSLEAAAVDSFKLRVSVANAKPSMTTSTSSVVVDIIAVDADAPVFEKSFYNFEVPEDAPLLSSIAQIKAVHKVSRRTWTSPHDLDIHLLT